MRIPAIYILLLLAAAVVLAFALELVGFYREAMRTPISEAANIRWWPQLDRRVRLRLAVVGGAALLAVAAAIITTHSMHPQRTSSLVRWVLDQHPESLLLAGVVLYLGALLCGAKLRQPLLLFCLTLPGLAIVPLLLLTGVTESNVVAAMLWYNILLFVQPGILILLFIAIGQSRLLRKPGGDFTSGGLVRVCLISIAYVFGFVTS
jgi:hypothetical protein